MENVYNQTGCKDYENGLFYKNIKSAVESNSTTKCGIQNGDPLTTVARNTKSIDIPGYRIIDSDRSITRIMKSLKLRPLLSFLELLNSGLFT